MLECLPEMPSKCFWNDHNKLPVATIIEGSILLLSSSLEESIVSSRKKDM
jgi:hypothetical protein